MDSIQTNDFTKRYLQTLGIIDRLLPLFNLTIEVENKALLQEGDIFVFNHFTRLETFIPHYILHKHADLIARSVAYHAFFSDTSPIKGLLERFGSISSQSPNIFTFLAAEILRNRKVILFPEGHMVKDKRVMLKDSQYFLHSSHMDAPRKLHKGAAILALTVVIFKERIQALYSELHTNPDKIYTSLAKWANLLHFASIDELLLSVQKPTRIVPVTMTFFPIVQNESLLIKLIEHLARIKSPEAHEELLTESSLLLSDTSVHLHVSEPIAVKEVNNPMEKQLMRFLFRHLKPVENLFALQADSHPVSEYLFHLTIKKTARKLRDQYAQALYNGVCLHQYHLIALVLHAIAMNKERYVSQEILYTSVFTLAILLESQDEFHLNTNLTEAHKKLSFFHHHQNPILDFLQSPGCMQHIKIKSNNVYLSKELFWGNESHKIRRDNHIQLYANEAKTIKGIIQQVNEAIKIAQTCCNKKNITIANSAFNQSIIAYWEDRQQLKEKPSLSTKEIIEPYGEPFFFKNTTKPSDRTLILIHGFMASPQEMKALGQQLHAKTGFNVMGIRLKGHGTHPSDLEHVHYHDWQNDLIAAIRIAETFSNNIDLVGFSTGALLVMGEIMRENLSEKIQNIMIISPALVLRKRFKKQLANLAYQITRLLPNSFIEKTKFLNLLENPTENPTLNYHQLPLKTLISFFKLQRHIKRNLSLIKKPCYIIFPEGDPVIHEISLTLIKNGMPKQSLKKIDIISTQKHAIINLYTDDLVKKILTFYDRGKTT